MMCDTNEMHTALEKAEVVHLSACGLGQRHTAEVLHLRQLNRPAQRSVLFNYSTFQKTGSF